MNTKTEQGPGYRLDPWPPIRNVINDLLDAHRPHTSYGMFEVDVTDALARIRAYQRELRRGISFHGYVLACFAKALAAHPYMQSLRFGNRLLTYEGVDVSTVIEKRLANRLRVPVAYVVRDADRKSLAWINWELSRAMESELTDDGNVRRRRMLTRMPWLIRKLFWRRVQSNPRLRRQYWGTAGLTNLHARGVDRPSYALPPNPHTCTLAVANIYNRLAVGKHGEPTERKTLCLTTAVDHAIVDGAPIVQFCRRLLELIESGHGLDEAFLEESKKLFGERKGETA